MIKKTKIDISDTIQQIGNDAVRAAQKKNSDNGIPNVYSKNGVTLLSTPGRYQSLWKILLKKGS